jgi:hypothetical protein
MTSVVLRERGSAAPRTGLLADLRRFAARLVERWRLPAAAKRARSRDRRGLPEIDVGIERAIDEAVAWLGRAQDCSASHDGGAARDYSLVTGWATSYPETSGYIVPTLIAYADLRRDEAVRARARRMLDWLVAIQFPDGGFQGGRIDAVPRVPVTFNTGQILLGLAAGAATFGEPYRAPMRLAADWLARSQDADGAWRRHPTPFAEPGEKAYETHVAWGLIEAARVEPGRGYGEAALANVAWALGKQQPNGWIADCCLNDPVRPLTHTLGYALRGVLEAWRFSGDHALLEAAQRTADGLLSTLGPEGFLPGRLHADWRPAADWACLTGSAQVAHCWLMLFEDTGDPAYRDAGFAANAFVRRTMSADGPPEVRGGIKGSFPVDGGYGAYEYLNWAAKFFIDSHMLEARIRARG